MKKIMNGIRIEMAEKNVKIFVHEIAAPTTFASIGFNYALKWSQCHLFGAHFEMQYLYCL